MSSNLTSLLHFACVFCRVRAGAGPQKRPITKGDKTAKCCRERAAVFVKHEFKDEHIRMEGGILNRKVDDSENEHVRITDLRNYLQASISTKTRFFSFNDSDGRK